MNELDLEKLRVPLEMPSHPEGFRSGFACFVGRPNVGKSTLMNALVGQKVAITSSRPQTTRRTVRGIVHRPEAQLIIVDTPGLHKPRTLLGERLDSLVRSTLVEVDVIAFCLPADEPIGGVTPTSPRSWRSRRTPRWSRWSPRRTWWAGRPWAAS